jgi:hypothetical protein
MCENKYFYYLLFSIHPRNRRYFSVLLNEKNLQRTQPLGSKEVLCKNVWERFGNRKPRYGSYLFVDPVIVIKKIRDTVPLGAAMNLRKRFFGELQDRKMVDGSVTCSGGGGRQTDRQTDRQTEEP